MKKYVKCVVCGWRYGNIYHICRVWPPETPLGNTIVKGRTFFTTKSHRENMSESQKERWEAYRRVHKVRDTKLVERYLKGDINYDNLAKEFGVSRSTVVSVMKKAKVAGVPMPRNPGQRTGISS